MSSTILNMFVSVSLIASYVRETSWLIIQIENQPGGFQLRRNKRIYSLKQALGAVYWRARANGNGVRGVSVKFKAKSQMLRNVELF